MNEIYRTYKKSKKTRIKNAIERNQQTYTKKLIGNLFNFTENLNLDIIRMKLWTRRKN